MENTANLGLKITTPSSWSEDDVKETWLEYGKNFGIIDKIIADSTGNPEELKIGQLYSYGARLWDNSPTIGEHIGFVNVREGVYAPKWEPLKKYTVGDYVRPTTDNGNAYQCVVGGRSMNKTPTFLTNKNIEFYDAIGNQWMANYNYEVDDVVFSTDGTKVYYYICETSGLSDIVEPKWDTVNEGITHIDGSVVWRKEKAIKWKQVASASNFRPFGKIE